MARGKKAAKELSPKEKLQQALVPAEEQPYPIPENWCWVRFDSVVDGFQYGYTEKATYEKVGPHFIRITDIGNGIIDNRSAPYCRIDAATYPKYKIHKNDIFIARMGSVGENGIALEDINAVFASYLIRVIPKISATLVIDYLQSPLYWGQITDKSQGTTRLNVNANVLKKLLFPLPPLSEQHRIVSRIESLFAKLDEAKEKAQAVVDGFELRKSAILHKAFTGELTERWRSKNDMSLTDWRQVKFGDLGVLERGRSKHRPRNDPKLFGGKYPFIQTGDVARSGMYVVEHSQTLSEIGMEQSRIFPKDTLCITIAANIGDVAILTYDCCFPDSVVGFTPNDLTSSKFIYYMMSTIQHELEATAPATAQKNINLKILNDLMINLPSISEQREIITVLENIFEKQQQAKEAAEAVLAQIDTMKKAILARAFRGELGTNNPEEEWAGELLKKTL